MTIQPEDRKCPSCESPDPARHPAVQFEGEVHICPDSFHQAAKPEEETFSDSKKWLRASAAMWRRSYIASEYANNVLRKQLQRAREIAEQRSGAHGG